MTVHDFYLGLVLATFCGFAITLFAVSNWSNSGKR